jgi:hypothetical protein
MGKLKQRSLCSHRCLVCAPSRLTILRRCRSRVSGLDDPAADDDDVAAALADDGRRRVVLLAECIAALSNVSGTMCLVNEFSSSNVLCLSAAGQGVHSLSVQLTGATD